MCGICGIINRDKENTVSPQRIRAMCSTLAHRGPDDSTQWSNGHVGLGHLRLSIIDIAGGQQPCSNEDGTIQLIYNGELYNYKKLREILIARGHRFRTNSDTEVILRSYEEYGVDCLGSFRGMFAFALYDRRKELVFAARDRIGIKPFYYTLQKEGLVFASEIKAILTGCDVDRSLSEQNLYSYLRLRYVPGAATIFTHIHKLQPGHYLLFQGGTLRIERYWDLADTAPLPPERYSSEELQEQFNRMLQESVRMRMMSEVPLGALLSGGLDSSVVVALMSAVSPGKTIETFSVGYENDYGVNEFAYARQVAEKFQTKHHEYRISSEKFFDFIPKLVWYLDEPVADSACIPLFFLSAYAKKYVTVILSGEGADELLAGYGLYRKMLQLRKIERVTRGLQPIFQLAYTFCGNRKRRKYLELLLTPLEQRYKGISAAFDSADLAAYSTLNGERFEPYLVEHFRSLWKRSGQNNLLNSMMYVDMNSWLPDDLLMKADKMTMAASQELRVPFLDHKLVEFAFSLPLWCKVDGRESKYLLRNLGRSLLPPDVVTRPKKGFPVPITYWFQKDFHEASRAVLTENNAMIRGIFQERYVRELLSVHENQSYDNSELLWNILVLEFWYKAVQSIPSFTE